MPSRNQAIIDEFRANEGRVGGYFEGRPILLLTHTGARTGRKYTNPVVYLPDDGRLVIFATKGGAPSNPAWYGNLKAHPTATVEVGTERYDVDVAELHGEERDRLYARQTEIMPTFAEYEARTSRRIPVLALTRRS
jgi:deazaflavin-dependent oxidoreductase (nitroreductase family)